MMDIHHIYEKRNVGSRKKGYPDWIHSPINLIEVEHWNHINNIDIKNTSANGVKAKRELYEELLNRTAIQYAEGKLNINDKAIVEQMYYFCLIQNFKKDFKNWDLIREYERVCEKFLEEEKWKS